MSEPLNPKQIAGEYAAGLVQDGMTVGLGTGSTAAYAVDALARRVREEGLRLRGIPTSQATETRAREGGIPLAEWEPDTRFDITIDGADEVDPKFRLIKGGGGALLREKIIASHTDQQIIIVDPSKMVPALGHFPLPVALAPFGWTATRKRLEDGFGCPTRARQTPDGSLFLSDDGLVILDLLFQAPLPDPDTLEARLKTTPGVVEVGLFVGLCHRVVIGHADGRIEDRPLTA